MNVIHINELRFGWKGQTNNTLSIKKMNITQGEHVLLRGESGSGKTTLLNLLAGILTPSSGELTVLGQNLQTLKPAKRDRFRADHMGIIFQQFNLLPYLSVVDNVTLPCQFSSSRAKKAGNQKQTAIRLLNHLGIGESLSKRAVSELSVGQQQRVAAARALIGQPEIIIADEPTSALDTNKRDHFLKLLFQEANAQNSTILFVSHDPAISGHFSKIIELADINQVGEKA
jgi:putative ABC transport system ATP-binding protein